MRGLARRTTRQRRAYLSHGGAVAFAHMQQRLERLARARPGVERHAERRGDGDSRRSDQRRQLACEDTTDPCWKPT